MLVQIPASHVIPRPGCLGTRYNQVKPIASTQAITPQCHTATDEVERLPSFRLTNSTTALQRKTFDLDL